MRRMWELWLLIKNPRNLHKGRGEWRTILRCEALLDGVPWHYGGESRPFFVHPSGDVDRKFGTSSRSERKKDVYSINIRRLKPLSDSGMFPKTPSDAIEFWLFCRRQVRCPRISSALLLKKTSNNEGFYTRKRSRTRLLYWETVLWSRS